MKISVVTVCFNAEKEIERTILSVINQAYNDFEYIVIDGKSNDNTMSIVNHYADHITKIVSEPDHGIYEAMNKGIRVSNGKYLLFMNAGDVFCDMEVLVDVRNFIEENKVDADVIYGNVIYVTSSKETVGKVLPLLRISHTMIASHQSTFVKRDLLQQTPFDLTYKYAADYHLLSNLFLRGCSFLYINRIISKVTVDTGTTFENFVKSKQEVLSILKSRRCRYAYYYFMKEILRFKVVRLLKVLGVKK